MDPFSQKKTKNIKETANILEVETDEKHSKTRTVIYYLHSDGQDDQIKRHRERGEKGPKKSQHMCPAGGSSRYPNSL